MSRAKRHVLGLLQAKAACNSSTDEVGQRQEEVEFRHHRRALRSALCSCWTLQEKSSVVKEIWAILDETEIPRHLDGRNSDCGV